MEAELRPSAWFRLPEGLAAQVIDTETVWGRRTARVFVPEKGTVRRVPVEELGEPAAAGPRRSADFLAYAAAAARLADALERDALVARSRCR